MDFMGSVPVRAINYTCRVGATTRRDGGAQRVARARAQGRQSQHINRFNWRCTGKARVRVAVNFETVLQQRGPRDVQSVRTTLPTETRADFASVGDTARDG